ncbi:ARS binding protein 2-domain-containing protein, partial [Fusarium venenatum]|uniref:ARS binding protein 2-domain-containing protein n=1 Tax=Fusarium venenatum TaxID=56646 RepID=UPI001D313708
MSSPVIVNPRPPPAQPPPQSGVSGAGSGSAAPPSSDQSFTTVRPGLPDRRVSEHSVDNAYVDFILFCNPAVPLSTDTTCLREAFRNPPQLTTKLGVEPPDPNKEESAQKVAQYGVRLKKWMNSMHVKAFFEYLMDIPNDYWTRIPTDSNPTSQPIRDGVALEDDMALRALFPHIRPKRGRKRPVEDDTATSLSPAPTQAQIQTHGHSHRSHLAPSSAVDGVSGPMSADPSRLTGAPWTPSDIQQTPLFRWPQSAITPTSRNSFWDDALEPQSAVTPSRPKLATQRRGPKNVSSAWRPGVANGTVKPRGRPPMNRTSVDVSLPPFSVGTTTATTTDEAESEPAAPIYTPPVSVAPKTDDGPPGGPVSIPSITSQPHPIPPRPSRPSISLTVPNRPSGSVRLATPPPPVVVINGQPSETQRYPHPAYSGIPPSHFSKATQEAAATSRQRAQNEEEMTHPKDVPRFYFERLEDRTNVDEVIAYMMRGCFAAIWLDAEDNPAHVCTTHEAMAITNCILEEMYKTAISPQAFLINLAAVTGGGYLLSGKSKIKRLGVNDGAMKYSCEWEYGFGHFRGTYHMEQIVPLELLEEQDASLEPTSEGSGTKLSTDEWQAKYENLLMAMGEKDKKFMDLRTKVTDLLKQPPKK